MPDDTTPAAAEMVAEAERLTKRHRELCDLLWEAGPAQAQWEGRAPDWDEVCADPKMLGDRMLVEAQARVLTGLSGADQRRFFGLISDGTHVVVDRMFAQALCRALVDAGLSLDPAHETGWWQRYAANVIAAEDWLTDDAASASRAEPTHAD